MICISLSMRWLREKKLRGFYMRGKSFSLCPSGAGMDGIALAIVRQDEEEKVHGASCFSLFFRFIWIKYEEKGPQGRNQPQWSLLQTPLHHQHSVSCPLSAHLVGRAFHSLQKVFFVFFFLKLYSYIIWIYPFKVWNSSFYTLNVVYWKRAGNLNCKFYKKKVSEIGLIS